MGLPLIRFLEKQVDRASLSISENFIKASGSIRKGCDSVDAEPRSNVPTFEIVPLTKTGKKPKFALEIKIDEAVWDDRTGMFKPGVVGVISYLQSGKLGKAHLTYHKDGLMYQLNFKEQKGYAVLSTIDYCSVSQYEWMRIYTA